MKEKYLKIKNFGPIKEGYNEDDGFMPFSKYVFFCGPQATGKSCVAKLFSTFSWIEKALVRGDYKIDEVTGEETFVVTQDNKVVVSDGKVVTSSLNRFVHEFCAFHQLQNYFKPETELHYKGTAFEMHYVNKELSINAIESLGYLRPQIIYVPAERNLLSVLDNAENVKDLPQSLSSFLSVYSKACKSLKGEIKLPINGFKFYYDNTGKTAYISDETSSVRISEASSGLQSLSPMYIALYYLSQQLQMSPESAQQKQSNREKEIMENRIAELLKDDTLSPTLRQMLIKQASDVTNKLLLSIVEEPEQNQFPTSQREMLYKLIALHNGENDQLVITTHSPYIINYLALAIKAYDIARRCPAATAELDKVVPQASMIDGAKVAVYQVHEDGTISLLPKYDEMPSDDNLLNNLLEESNEQFNQLLDIEEECQITK